MPLQGEKNHWKKCKNVCRRQDESCHLWNFKDPFYATLKHFVHLHKKYVKLSVVYKHRVIFMGIKSVHCKTKNKNLFKISCSISFVLPAITVSLINNGIHETCATGHYQLFVRLTVLLLSLYSSLFSLPASLHHFHFLFSLLEIVLETSEDSFYYSRRAYVWR